MEHNGIGNETILIIALLLCIVCQKSWKHKLADILVETPSWPTSFGANNNGIKEEQKPN